MSYQDIITVSVNKALKRKLLRESKSSSKQAENSQHRKLEFTRKRRNAEDMALAREIGVTIEELTE